MPRQTESKDEEVYRITIRMKPKEHKLAKMIAQYLYQNGLIKRNSINEAVNYSLLYLAYAIAQLSKSLESDEE